MRVLAISTARTDDVFAELIRRIREAVSGDHRLDVVGLRVDLRPAPTLRERRRAHRAQPVLFDDDPEGQAGEPDAQLEVRVCDLVRARRGRIDHVWLLGIELAAALSVSPEAFARVELKGVSAPVFVLPDPGGRNPWWTAKRNAAVWARWLHQMLP